MMRFQGEAFDGALLGISSLGWGSPDVAVDVPSPVSGTLTSTLQSSKILNLLSTNAIYTQTRLIYPLVLI
jgi:hypothetical protein